MICPIPKLTIIPTPENIGPIYQQDEDNNFRQITIAQFTLIYKYDKPI